MLIGHKLIHSIRLPEVTVGEVGSGQTLTLTRIALTPCPPGSGGEIAIELQDDLISIVDEASQVIDLAVTVRVDRLANPTILDVVEIVDDLRRIATKDCTIRDFDEPVAIVPDILRDVGVAGIQHTIGVHVDPPRRSIPLGIVSVPIDAIAQ